MQTVKGFVSIQALLSNTANVVAPLGELTTWSSTFSKDTGQYSATSVPGYRLTTFRSQANDGTPCTVTSTLVELILQLSQHLVQDLQLYPAPHDPVVLRNTVYALFPNAITDLIFGPIITDGQCFLPEWVTWTSGGQYPATAVTLWYGDAAFASQYSDYDITVIPPLVPVDTFFAAPSTVSALLAARSIPQLFEQIQLEKARHPETYVRSMTISYVPANGLPSVASHWAVLVYGEAGNTPDAIKDALIAFILSNSTHPRSEWEQRLPELFQRTEFIILPRWDRYSIPNRTVQTGLYASMVDPVEALAFAATHIPSYTAPHINANTTLMPYDYKAIMLCVVNGPTNMPSAARIQQLFPDYIPVPSTALDFNRMQETTRAWVVFLETLLLVAEEMTESNSLPASFRRSTRGAVTYLAADHNDVQYLMLPKYVFEAPNG